MEKLKKENIKTPPLLPQILYCKRESNIHKRHNVTFKCIYVINFRLKRNQFPLLFIHNQSKEKKNPYRFEHTQKKRKKQTKNIDKRSQMRKIIAQTYIMVNGVRSALYNNA